MSNQQVNLYQEVFHVPLQPLSVKTMFVIIAAGLSCTVLVLTYNTWQLYSKRSYLRNLENNAAIATAQQGDISSRMITLAPDPELTKKIQELEARLADQKQVEGLINQHLTDGSDGYSEYFLAFARHHLDDLWLTDITIGPDKTLSLRGQTNQPDFVPKYLRQLSSEDVLKGTEFQVFKLERSVNDDKKTINDTVNFLVSTELQEQLTP